MCIERLWPYWLLHWRTQYYGILTIIALYIVYLITFGCYLKAKWFIGYSWKRYSKEMFSKWFYGKPKKLMEMKVWEVCVQLHDKMKLWCFSEEIRFYTGKNVLKTNRCSDIPVSAIGLEWTTSRSWSRLTSCVYTVFYVHCKQLYPFLQILFEFASLCFSLFIVYCFFDILYKSYISLVL